LFHPAPGNAIPRPNAAYAGEHQPIVSVDKA
jgi:hypothetical protein